MERHPPPDVGNHAGVLGRRFEALLVDTLLVLVVSAVLGYVGGVLGAGSSLAGLGGAFLAAQFGAPLLLLVYQTAFEGYYGQTLGKRLRGIVVVVAADGSAVGPGSAVIRNLLRIIDVLPAFYLVGIVVAYLTDDHQRIGDVAGGTVVVHTTD